MSERDELLDVLNDNITDDIAIRPLRCDIRAQVEQATDALLAAGYFKPRTITTAEELDALPVQSVIRDAEDYVWERFGSGPASWDCAGVPDWESHLIALPATVLWEPR